MITAPCVFLCGALEIVGQFAFCRIWSALVQTHGWARSFQPSMNSRLGGQVADAGEGAAADGLAFNDAEPEFDAAHPRRCGRAYIGASEFR